MSKKTLRTRWLVVVEDAMGCGDMELCDTAAEARKAQREWLDYGLNDGEVVTIYRLIPESVGERSWKVTRYVPKEPAP